MSRHEDRRRPTRVPHAAFACEKVGNGIMLDDSQPKIENRPPSRFAALAIVGSMIGSVIAMAPALPGLLSVPRIEPIDLSVMGMITAAETSPEVLTFEPRPGLVAAADPTSVHGPRLPIAREQLNVATFIARKYRVAQDSVQDFVELAYKTAREHRMDPFLLLAVMSIESSFNPLAQSHKGAQGLMQVLTRVHADKFEPFGGVEAAFDPVANVKVGARILNEYLTREGSVEGALKSYVGAALRPHDNGYGSKVLGERERIAAAAAGKPVPGGPFGTAIEAKTESKQVDKSPEPKQVEPRLAPSGKDHGAQATNRATVAPASLSPADESPIRPAPAETMKRSLIEGSNPAAVDTPHSAIPDAQATAVGG